MRQARPGSGRVTGSRRRSSRHRSKPGKVVVEPGADRTRKRPARIAKEQAGSIDPGMEAAERRQPLRASEKPLRANRFRAEEKHAASQEALIRGPGNPGFGEQRGESSGAFACECSMPCMPVESQAGNKTDRSHVVL